MHDKKLLAVIEELVHVVACMAIEVWEFPEFEGWTRGIRYLDPEDGLIDGISVTPTTAHLVRLVMADDLAAFNSALHDLAEKS